MLLIRSFVKGRVKTYADYTHIELTDSHSHKNRYIVIYIWNGKRDTHIWHSRRILMNNNDDGCVEDEKISIGMENMNARSMKRDIERKTILLTHGEILFGRMDDQYVCECWISII